MSDEYWDIFYKSGRKVESDGWLDKYGKLIKNNYKILDLGCGNGVNISYFLNRKTCVYACDISSEAIRQVNTLYPACTAEKVDISKPLPFVDNYFDIIISDLSLHYFDKITTRSIVGELERILKKNGFFVGRVNSKKNLNKTKQMIEIEKDFYVFNGYPRRFFSEDDINNFFVNFKIVENKQSYTDKYEERKNVIEFVVQKL